MVSAALKIVSLDINRDDTDEGKGWIAIEEQGLILTFRGKTGWREVEIGRGSSDQTCPVHALECESRSNTGPQKRSNNLTVAE